MTISMAAMVTPSLCSSVVSIHSIMLIVWHWISWILFNTSMLNSLIIYRIVSVLCRVMLTSDEIIYQFSSIFGLF